VTNLRYRGAPLRTRSPPHRSQQLPRGGVRRIRHVPRGEGRLAQRREIRDLMVEYFGAHRVLPAKPDGNWRLVPPRAVETLVLEEAAAR